MEEMEKLFTCPHCGQTVTVLLDLSVKAQIYTEDCEVCCRPLEIRYSTLNGELREFQVHRTQ